MPSGGLFLPASAWPFDSVVLLLRNTLAGGWSGMF